jgi:SNF2 family DNA or RNA helicase
MAEILEERGVVWNLSEMRVGKLVELIALCRRLSAPDVSLFSVLVVAPLSTLLNVRDEFERWLGWRVYVNPVLPCAGCDVVEGREPYVVAINPEKLRDPNHWVFEMDWGLVALDECHRYRGRQAQQTKGTFRLARRSWRLVLMTGTPLMNGLPREIWPLLHLSEISRPLKERGFNSFWEFLAEHAVQRPGWGFCQAQDERAPWTKEGKKRIQEYLAPLVVRRTFAEVRPELPALVEQTIKLDLHALDPFHGGEYDRLEREWRVAISEDEDLDVPTKLALTTRLRQYAASPANLGSDLPGAKVKAIADWVSDQPGKGVIWCWHKAMAEVLVEWIGRARYLITGDRPPAERAEQCAKFRADTSPSILVATIGSLKEGIDLSTASWACFAERSWLPSDNRQAAMRIVGPDQAGSPLVTTFVGEGTIEEKVERVLAQKDKAINEFMMFQELISEVV